MNKSNLLLTKNRPVAYPNYKEASPRTIPKYEEASLLEIVPITRISLPHSKIRSSKKRFWLELQSFCQKSRPIFRLGKDFLHIEQ